MTSSPPPIRPLLTRAKDLGSRLLVGRSVGSIRRQVIKSAAAAPSDFELHDEDEELPKGVTFPNGQRNQFPKNVYVLRIVNRRESMALVTHIGISLAI